MKKEKSGGNDYFIDVAFAPPKKTAVVMIILLMLHSFQRKKNGGDGDFIDIAFYENYPQINPLSQLIGCAS